MNGFWSIVRRETAERRLLFLGALTLGLLPLAASLLPGQIGLDVAGNRIELAMLLGFVASGVTALVLGASVIVRDLAERRLSFYFARPLGSGTIWGGKMTAAAVLSLSTGILILLPAVLLDTRPEEGWPPGSRIPMVLLALLALLGLGHALSLLLRARSPWLVLDLAASFAVVALVLAAHAPLEQAGISAYQKADSLLVLGYKALIAISILAFLAAGAVQVAVGRTDPRRSHKVFSLTLWSVLVATALLLFGASRWVMDVEPGDLEEISWAGGAKAGPWIVAGGPARHRTGFFPAFLLDTSSGRAVRIQVLPSDDRSDPRYPFRFSDDGRHAVWLETQPGSAFQLMTLDLARPASRPLAAPIAFKAIPAMALSPDGSRLATIERDRLLVHGIPKGELLASVAFPFVSHVGFAFQGLDRVQVHSFDRDARSRKTIHTLFELQVSKNPSVTSRELEVREVKAWWLAFEKFAHRIDHERRELIIQGRDGLEKRVPLPGTKGFELGGQPSENHLVISATDEGGENGEVFLVDLAKGTLRPLARGLWPIGSSRQAEIGAPTTRLFLNEKELVRIDPETGQRTVVLELS